jgi:hypothetical protein
MKRDYDAIPDIPPFQGIEKGVQQYWDASLAWKGRPGAKTKYTVGRVLEVLYPLRLNPKSQSLRDQADELSKLVVAFTPTRPPIVDSEVIPFAKPVKASKKALSRKVA